MRVIQGESVLCPGVQTFSAQAPRTVPFIITTYDADRTALHSFSDTNRKCAA